MATIFIFDLITTIDKNLYVIYNILYNQGVFIMENEKENNKVYIKPFIILFLISIVIFAIMYFLHSKNIENRFNRTLQNYEKSINLIFENAITNNGSNENIYYAKEDLKLSFEVGFKMLESSINEIMKNSNDILQFWFAFLSIIMIVFTLIGFFLNNNILENAKKQLEMVENEAKNSIDKIKSEAKNETDKLIQESSRKIQENNLFNLGIQSLNSKDYKLAIYYFTEVIKLNPKNYQAYYNKGLAKYYLADNKKENKEEYNKLMNEAIEDYNKAIELNPNLSEAYNNRGIVKSKLGNYKESIEDFNKAIELNPDYYKAYSNRADSKMNLEKYEKALKDFIKAYELSNNNIEVKEKAKSQLIILAKNGNETAIKFCEEHNINYNDNKE